jgi:hypothetical protein
VSWRALWQIPGMSMGALLATGPLCFAPLSPLRVVPRRKWMLTNCPIEAEAGAVAVAERCPQEPWSASGRQATSARSTPPPRPTTRAVAPSGADTAHTLAPMSRCTSGTL